MKQFLIFNLIFLLLLLQCLAKKKIKKNNKKPLPLKKPPPYIDKSTGKMTVYVKKKYQDKIKTIFYHLTTRTCLKYNIRDEPIRRKSGINFFESSRYNRVKLSYKKYKPTKVELKSYIFNNRTKLAFYVGLALGMIPETKRRDRKNYVEIKWNNIKNSYKKYYRETKYNYSFSPNEEFDFGSVMLVDPSFGSKNKRKPTYKLKTYKKYNKIYDKYNIFSHSNFRFIYEMYCRKKCSKEDDCQNGSFHGKDCDFCICPPHFYGRKCQHFMYNIGKCGDKKEYTSTRYLYHVLQKNVNGKCAYSIKSKKNNKIVLEIGDIILPKSNCTVDDSYVEILYRQDRGTTGFTICKNVSRLLFTPLSSEAFIYVNAPTPKNYIRVYFWDYDPTHVVKRITRPKNYAPPDEFLS